MTTSPANIPTLGTNNFTPGAFTQINWGVGFTGGQAPVSVLLIGNAQAGSPAVRDTVIYGPNQVNSVKTKSDVQAVFGARSELYRGFKRFTAECPSVSVNLLATSEAMDTAAYGSVTFAGTAVASGSVRTFIGDTFVDTLISIGDTAADVCYNVAASVNTLLDIAATAPTTYNATSASAPFSTGTMSFTSAQRGERGNQIRYSCKVVGNSVGITSSAESFAYFSGGSMTDNFTVSTVLSTIYSSNFTYIIPAYDDATLQTGTLFQLVQQVVNQAQAVPGNFQRVYVGNVGSVSTQNTFSQLINSEIVDSCGRVNSNYTAFELACGTCGAIMQGETNGTVPQLNFDDMATHMLSPFDGSAVSPSDIDSSLVSGTTPLNDIGNGFMKIVSAVTTFSIDPVSHNMDLFVRDHSDVTVAYYVRQLLQNLYNQFKGTVAADDPVQGGKLPGGVAVVTPSAVKLAVANVLRKLDVNGGVGLLQDVDNTIASLQVTHESPRSDRFTVICDFVPVDLFHQFAFILNQDVVQQ